MREEQPSSLPSTAKITRRNQSERPTVLNSDSTNMEITTGQSKHPQFLKSIDDLVAFSSAVIAFKRHYDDLQNHMDYIQNAIDSAVILDQPPPEPFEKVPDMLTEVQRLCELMCSKGLRKYIYTNISDRAKLIEELPEALKQAKEPAKFVLECIGKFYLQGRKAFSKDSPMIPARQVSLVILESFLLMKLKVKIESCVKDEAEAAAVAWKKRLVVEGGLAAADQMDARGLLLLIACFGVPSNFKKIDLLDLITKSGSAEIACALKRSSFLVPMVSGIVESSIKRGMHIEALELVYTFGMEHRFSPSSLLTALLRTSEESFERAKQKARSPMAFKEANEKQLAALSSVMQCLEAYKLDPAKEVPEWQIKEQIVKLKKDTLQLNKEMKEKARSMSLMEDAERLYNPQMKRPRLSAMEMSPVASSSYSPMYRDQSFHSQRDEDRDDISALVSSYLSPSSAFPHRSSLRRSSPEYMAPHGGGLGRYVSAYEHKHPNSYSPVSRMYSPVPAQRPPRLYSPPIHGQQQQIPFGLQRVYRHSPSVERYSGLPEYRSPRRNSSLDHI